MTDTKKKVFKCKNCEAVVNDSDKHCTECGKVFVGDAAKVTIGIKTVPQFLASIKSNIETALFEKNRGIDMDKERHSKAVGAIDSATKELMKAVK